MTKGKDMISAQMDTSLIEQLNAYAKAQGVTRSAAVRLAIVKLLDEAS
jgi:metal-responsive CopG/Arc/MetJ family transcriptional regulator